MQITYCGAHDSVILAIDGREVGCVKGSSVDVPDAIAGTAPAVRLAPAMAELVTATAAHNHEVAQPLRDEIALLDFGTGLLAQPENWQPVKHKPTAPATPAKEA
jgi:hypothetical protein